jgi:hypothetical protein
MCRSNKIRSKSALIMDESTSISGESVLILYLRAAVCHIVSSFFLELVQLASALYFIQG